MAKTVAALTGGLVGSGVGSALTRADIPGPAAQATQIDADPPREIDVLMAESKKRLADRAREVDRLSVGDNPVRLSGNGRTALVSASPDRPGKWRLTIVGDDGVPNGHIDTDTKPAAIRRALEDGYTAKQVGPAVSEAVDAPRAGITQDAAAPRVLGEAETNEMRKLIARAANNNTAARKRLAEMAKVDPEALAAAERLGIEVPVDVFATNSAVQQAAGIVRAVRGSDASAEWEDAFISAQKRANDIIEGQGGTLDLASVADRVQTALTNSIDDLRAKGSAIFESIKKEIPTGTRVQPNASTKAVSDILADLGGEESLPPIVRGLFKAVTSEQGMTYGRLMQERGQIGKAIAKSQGPYADADSFTLGKLYAALGEDQMNFIGAELGDAAAAKLKNGNALWSSAKDLEGKLVAGFGKDQQGSIANTLRTAMTNASKGDAGRLNRILDVIPKGLQRESMLTALADMSQARSGQGGFSFSQYAKLYRGLRNNSSVYKRVADSVGKETADLMRDLYEVSIRVDRAAQNVPRTGMANQALIADGLISKVVNSSVGKAARGTAAGVAGSAVGGPLLGSLAAVGAASGNLGKGRAQAVGALFRNADFQRMAADATRGTPSDRSIARVANSPAFLRWAKSSGISDPQTWLRGALTPQQAITLSNGAE